MEQPMTPQLDAFFAGVVLSLALWALFAGPL
jgi:hypothetical protein